MGDITSVTMNNQQRCTLVSFYLFLMICSGLQLLNTSLDCHPCSCHPDQHYGGTLANCSHIALTKVSLPASDNITTLLLDYTDINKLVISDFEGMTELRHLSIRASSITNIEGAHRVIFTNLVYLDLSRNLHLRLSEIRKVGSWLRKGTLKTLFIDFIVTLWSSILPLDRFHCSFLQQTALEEIHLDGNAFLYIGKDLWVVLPKTIEVISVRYTMLADFVSENITGLLQLSSLRSLDLTGLVKWNPGNGHGGSWHETVLPSIMFIMPSIEVFSYKGTYLKANVGDIAVLPLTNNLTEIDLSNNMLTALLGPIKGLKNLEYFDLSKNMISSVGKSLFTGSNRVRIVNISNNYLGQCIEKDTSGDLLKQFADLEVLDISMNGITFLPKKMLRKSFSLRFLNVSGNYLSFLDVDFIHMSNLRELNLRNNKLNKLSSWTIEQLNLLPNVTVIINDNPLICSCDTLDFLEWMKDSKQLQEVDNLTCTLTNGSSRKLQHLDDILSSLHESCKSDLVLIVSSVSGAVSLLLLFSGFMVYRHRWKLRYFYQVGRKRYQLLSNEDDFDIYTYDAFISYADKDRTFVIKKLLNELEDKSGLKVCIHNRDFLPGDIISENIINAIQNSRKTVIVLSTAFLKSEWCIYEFNMARLDGISRKLNNLLVVLLEEVDVKQLPKDLAVMMTTNSYLEYSTEIYGEAVFWNSLKEGLKTIKRLE